MSKIFVLGSINMDASIQSPYIPSSGETLKGDNFFLNPGGKGANQAVASLKLGADVTFIGAIGNDIFGKQMYDDFINKYNMDCTYINIIDNVPTGVAIIIICNNDNRIILNSGANYKINKKQIDEAFGNALKDDIFITQLENNEDAILYGIKKAKEKEMKVIFNPAPAKKLDNDIYKYVDYLIVNETEFEIITNYKFEDNNDLLLKVFKNIKVKNMIITLGDKGSILIDNDLKITKIKPYKIDAIDTTAAGDSFVGAFAYMLVNKNDVITSLNYASVVASITCLRLGAQQAIPSRKQVDEFLKNK